MGEVKDVIVREEKGIKIIEYTDETVISNNVVLRKEDIEAQIATHEAEITKLQGLLDTLNAAIADADPIVP